MKKSLKFLLSVAFASLVSVSYAQTIEEADAALKKGSELLAAKDYAGAITALKQCIDISTKVGADADEFRKSAEKPLPNLYLLQADKLAEDKDLNGTIKALQDAEAAADKYNQPEIKEKVVKPMGNAYLALGNQQRKEKKFAEALQSLDKATQINADLATAYLLKGSVFLEQKDEAKMVENFKLAIEKGEAVNDSKTVKSAKNTWCRYYFNKGIAALKEKKTDAAIPAFQKAVEADDTFADAYYRLASCFITKNNYDKAIENAEKAITLKKDGNEAIYYTLGEAYMGKKVNAKACEAFAKVTSGPYAERAKYYRDTTLKCGK